MNKVEIRGSKGMNIGYIRDCGAYIEAVSYSKGYVGRYHKGNDNTIDCNGKVISRGSDMTAYLVMEASN
jgi:hypothetical protein